ncbi:MAG: putative porin, partial [Muribaculaceae bacterium]|nr:putative porin [Muribaculaceae bacterium]
MKRLILHIIALILSVSAALADDSEASVAETAPAPRSYAWRFVGPLGGRTPAGIDTLMLNYAQKSVPSLVFGPASAITGNYGAAGLDMTYFTRPEPTQFMFDYVLLPYLPDVDRQVFYNTRIPMTLLGYETGGAKNVAQDHFHMTFSGNINKRSQVGVFVDFPYSRGYYANQSMKDFAWGANGSYMGDHYEMQAALVQFNSLNKENGGITDDRYITDPEAVQGGSNSLSSTSIPVYLSRASNRVRGLQLLVNNRYKLGFHRTEPPQPGDTVERRTFVPVTAFAHTFKFTDGYHCFRDRSASDASYWSHSYID